MFLKRLCCTLLVVLLFSVNQLAFADTRKASSLSEFFALVQIHTTMLEESFSVPSDPLVVEALEKKSSVGENDTVLSEIMCLAGCSGSFSYSCYDDHIQLSDVSYYAGWRIMQQYAAGRLNSLSDKETGALNNALTLVNKASGTPLEKERYLYDALCGLITYDATDDSSGEKDCAIGALVNNRADCDGYADAMMLCCYLAGIPCSMIHGQAVKSVQDRSDSSSHMWNLVFIENSWLMCDVTWGDQEGGPNYLYFNLGRQDASFSYLWDDSFLFKEIAEKADFNSQLMPDQRPFLISSYDDIYYAARNAALAGSHRLFLYSVNEQPLWKSDQDAFWSMLHHGAFGACSYNESGRFFEICNISLPDVSFSFCDNEEETLSAIRLYADSGISSFSLYFRPAFADRLFADNQSYLQQLLSKSLLANSGQYVYSIENGSVTFTDASFSEATDPCISAENVISFLCERLPSQPSTITILLVDDLNPESVMNQIATTVYSHGVSSFYYSVIGNRITLSDLSYYDNYCFADSEDDVLTYMQLAKANALDHFRFYCSDTLYSSLSANNASVFFSLLNQTGFTDYSVSHSNDYCIMIVENAK